MATARPAPRSRSRPSGLADYHAILIAKKYGYARPGLIEQPWGATSMTIADPFFNRIEFSERHTDTKNS